MQRCPVVHDSCSLRDGVRVTSFCVAQSLGGGCRYNHQQLGAQYGHNEPLTGEFSLKLGILSSKLS